MCDVKVVGDLLVVDFSVLFFVKQKTAYEMRISDWSSDVCSSDRSVAAVHELAGHESVTREDRRQAREILVGGVGCQDQDGGREDRQDIEADPTTEQIGRAS